MSEGRGRIGNDGNNVRGYVLTCRVEVLRRPRDFVQHHLTSMFMSRFGANLLTADGDVSLLSRSDERDEKEVSGVLIDLGTGLASAEESRGGHYHRENL